MEAKEKDKKKEREEDPFAESEVEGEREIFREGNIDSNKKYIL